MKIFLDPFHIAQMSHPVAGHASGNIAGGGGGYTDHRV